MIIREDTVWTSGSIVDASDGVEIARDATLTIEDGVTVQGGSITAYGDLVIAGTAESRVVFEKTTLAMSSLDWDLPSGSITGSYFDLRLGEDTYSAGISNSGYNSASLKLDNVYFDGLDYLYLSDMNSDSYIENSLFWGVNSLEIYGNSSSFALRNNTFDGPGRYAPEDVYTGSRSNGNLELSISGPLELTGNNFFTLTEAESFHYSGHGTDLDASGNYFGTTDPDAIAEMIFDGNDSLSRSGVVTIKSLLQAANPDAPDISQFNVPAHIATIEELVVDENPDESWYADDETEIDQVISFEAVDPEGAELSYTILGADAEHFWFDYVQDGYDSYSVTGLRASADHHRVGDENSWILDGYVFDYENPRDSDGDGVFDITLVIFDGYVSTTHDLSIRVVDVAEYPSELLFDGISWNTEGYYEAITVAENVYGAEVAKLSAVDPDLGDTHSFSIESDIYEIVGDVLKLKDDVALNFEESDYGYYYNSYNIVVTDSAGNVMTHWFDPMVADANDAPEGTVEIYGETVVGGTLWFDEEAVTDEDGISGDSSYQWLRDGVEIRGANWPGYELTEFDVGAEISVRISYTDDRGTEEVVFSETSAKIADVVHDVVGSEGDDRLEGGNAGDTLEGLGGDDELLGHAGDDVLYGDDGDDRLFGHAGDDDLLGGKGRDLLEGGVGNDRYLVDRKDTVVEHADEGYDEVYSFDDIFLGDAEIEVAVLLGKDDTWVHGNGADTEIYGNSGDNVLIGGGGSDEMLGGKGADIFVFDPRGFDGTDHIHDFGRNDKLAFDDRLFGLGDGDIDRRIIDAEDALGLLKSGQVGYSQRSGEFWIDSDGRGGAEAHVFAVLEDAPAITAQQIMLF